VRLEGRRLALGGDVALERDGKALVQDVGQLAADFVGVAQALVDRLAQEVSDLVTTTLRRLGLGVEAIDVVLGGGLMQAGNVRLDEAIDRTIIAAAPKACVVRPAAPPIAGAALLALDMLGAGPATDAVVRETFTTDVWREAARRATAQAMGASDG